MADIIQQITDWLNTEPNQTEVIVMRKERGDFEVTFQYGNRTTVPVVDADLGVALSKAVTKASKLPSAKRHAAEKKTVVVKLPGMT